MTSIPLKLTLAGLLSLGAGTSALAQAWYPGYTSAQPQYATPSEVPPPSQSDYDYQQQQYQDAQQSYQDQQQQYQEQKDRYQNQRGAYDARTQAWRDRRDVYDAQRNDYSDERAAYEQERADYDARYGAGAWERRYGYGDRDGYAYYRGGPCERRQTGGAVAGGVIGALAGAAIGSSVAGEGAHATGAVLGGLACGAVGAAVGSDAAKCDSSGYYYSYEETYPYRVADARGPDGQYGYDYYRHHNCRLAIAPAYVEGSLDDRYVRVCPDSAGRYRITP
jgi:type II secretory pathway pseudopilin PulG